MTLGILHTTGCARSRAQLHFVRPVERHTSYGIRLPSWEKKATNRKWYMHGCVKHDGRIGGHACAQRSQNNKLRLRDTALIMRLSAKLC